MAALQGTVQTLTSQAGATQAFQTQIADGMKSLTEAVNKTVDANSTANSTDSDYVTRTITDPGDDQHRMMAQRDQIGTVSLKLLTTMVENADALMKGYLKYADGVWASSVDHFRSLPPIAPRSASGPGTTAS